MSIGCEACRRMGSCGDKSGSVERRIKEIIKDNKERIEGPKNAVSIGEQQDSQIDQRNQRKIVNVEGNKEGEKEKDKIDEYMEVIEEDNKENNPG